MWGEKDDGAGSGDEDSGHDQIERDQSGTQKRTVYDGTEGEWTGSGRLDTQMGVPESEDSQSLAVREDNSKTEDRDGKDQDYVEERSEEKSQGHSAGERCLDEQDFRRDQIDHAEKGQNEKAGSGDYTDYKCSEADLQIFKYKSSHGLNCGHDQSEKERQDDNHHEKRQKDDQMCGYREMNS